MSTQFNAENGRLAGWLQLVETNSISLGRESWAKFSELKTTFPSIKYTLDPATTAKVREIYSLLDDMVRRHQSNSQLPLKIREILPAIQAKIE